MPSARAILLRIVLPALALAAGLAITISDSGHTAAAGSDEDQTIRVLRNTHSINYGKDITFRLELSAEGAPITEIRALFKPDGPRVVSSYSYPDFQPGNNVSASFEIPTSGNDFVGMVKDTSLVGIIGIFELYRTGQKLVSDTFLPFEVWTGVAVMYIIVVFAIDLIVRLVEHRLRPGLRTRGPLAKRKARRMDELANRVRAAAPATAGLAA